MIKSITLSKSKSAQAESTKLETVMCYIFSAGVIATSIFAIISIIFLYQTQGHINLLKERGAFIHQQSFFSLISTLINGTNMPQGTLLFATLGLTSLVLTPLLVVAMACIYFALKKNLKYVVITLIVIAILITSLALH